ncbi:MAG TPA: preprotein translocase subunit SecG [Firmicutes bacterium]|nr:preprotein translocase subunit SecG [Bacillota bacterium]
MRTALIIFQFLVSFVLIAAVVLQSSKGEGLGSIGGGAQLFFAKNKGWDDLLNKVTTIAAVFFLLSSIVLSVVSLG